MKCPRCNSVELITTRHKTSSVVLDCCPRCHGVWFDEGELEHVVDVAAKDLTPPGLSHNESLPCPRCEQQMTSFLYPQTEVVVDMCRRCSGIWLDGPEFKEIKAVRENFRRKGRLEEYAPLTGLKGALIHAIDAAIERLKFW